MALTNILKEPRREITETLMGVGAIGGLVLADYLVVTWLCGDYVPRKPDDLPYAGMIAFSMFLLPLLLVILGVVIAVIHAVGDWACEMLEDHGIQLRPTKRYR